MEQYIALYNQYSFVLSLALALMQVVLVVGVVLIHVRLSRVERNYERLFRDAAGQSLQSALETYVSRVDGNARRVEDLSRDFRRLAEVARNAVQHVGLVRFNPFSDTGSDQSFSVAFLDDFDTGVVITSLHNRASTRVYAKPIQKGQPVYPLSNEEKEAFETARRGGLKQQSAKV